MEAEIEGRTELPSSDAELGSPERAIRLRDAVRAAGGNNLVSQRSGVPISTLASYIRGRDMKASGLIRLAEATGVRLEWLATGEGSMRAGAPAEPPPQPPAGPFLLFGNVKIDRLVRAYEGALASSGGDRRLTMHLTVVLHDQLAQAEDATAGTKLPAP